MIAELLHKFYRRGQKKLHSQTGLTICSLTCMVSAWHSKMTAIWPLEGSSQVLVQDGGFAFCPAVYANQQNTRLSAGVSGNDTLIRGSKSGSLIRRRGAGGLWQWAIFNCAHNLQEIAARQLKAVEYITVVDSETNNGSVNSLDCCHQNRSIFQLLPSGLSPFVLFRNETTCDDFQPN